MWEREDENIVLFPQNSPIKGEKPDSVLLFQIAGCTVFIVLSLLLRLSGGPAFEQAKESFAGVMEDGITTSQQEEIVRFANATIEYIRTQLNTPIEGGAGGAITQSSTKSFTGPYFLSDIAYTPAGGYVSSAYGARKHPITGKPDMHTGLDIAAQEGSAVSAAFYGIVTKTAFDAERGFFIEVMHSNRVVTTYNHLKQIFVQKGDTVVRGQTIAAVGSTGTSTGPHLHFEIKVNGIYVDPAQILPQLTAVTEEKS
ncbi:MAG: M23 family metallopeptidase [Oscillospiraceae bacterium]|nr:M23 family metallopeptidase [Oscillospiraceae bacterium]